jgi:hypothetical protein
LREIDGRDVESPSPVGDDKPDVVVEECNMHVGNVDAAMHDGISGRFGESDQNVLDAQVMHSVCAEEVECLVSGSSQVRGSQQKRQPKLVRNRRQCGPPPLRA